MHRLQDDALALLLLVLLVGRRLAVLGQLARLDLAHQVKERLRRIQSMVSVSCQTQVGSCTYLVDVLAGLGRRLYVGLAPPARLSCRFVAPHRTPVLQVRLVADEDERHVLRVLHAQYLLPFGLKLTISGGADTEDEGLRERGLPEFVEHRKRLVLSDGEHEEEALAAAEVVVPDG